jgi:hypothetical protein
MRTRSKRRLLVLLASVTLLGGVIWAAGTARAKRADSGSGDAAPAKLPVPAVSSIRLEPESLVLQDGRDGRQVLVWGITDDGRRYDLTDEAAFKSDSANLSIVDGHFVYPQADGDGTVTITAQGKEAKLAVKVVSAAHPKVRFEREVMPVLAAVGCNAGLCHGSAKGKNGFKLSLRGYDADFDYNALVNDLQGRRVNRVQPEQSLMLLKPTATVPHEGKQVIKPGSRQYNLIYQWIKEGVQPEPQPSTSRPDRVEVLPREVYLDLPGRTQRVIVLAYYPDGSNREVTRDAILSSSNTEVATMDANRITALRRGESAVLVRYEGQYAAVNVTVMGDRTGVPHEPMPEYNYVDKFVNAKLDKMKIQPSQECTDADFLRRVYLDLTGIIPTADQSRAFLNDPAPSREKREKLVDSLIGTKDFVAYWSNKWADLLQCNEKSLGEKAVWAYREWIRQSVAQNKPYDQFVREIIDAEGSSLDDPAVNYYRSLKETGKMTEDISQTFLGVRFSCNKCHDHPFEKWTQTQYYQFGAFFARVAYKPGTHPGEEIVYNNYAGGDVINPRTAKVMDPVVPYGAEPDLAKSQDRQHAFAQWLTSKDNPLFARSYANRCWSYFFGRGIIDPVDDIRASNPPVNPELLDALTDDFIKGGFNIQHLMRTIVLSRTYQLSVKTNQWNADDKINFSHALPRRLTAEQIMDAVSIATGVEQKVPGLPEDMRCVYLADGSAQGSDFLKLFGRPKRETACECERTTNLSLAHALNLVNGSLISGAVDQPDNAIAKLVAKEPDNRKVIDGIYLSVLNRLPTDIEVANVDLGAGARRLEVAQDLAWALLNSPAFLFNR